MTPDNTARLLSLCSEMSKWAKKQGMTRTAVSLDKITKGETQ